jgi:hypothetical protein
MTSAGHRIGKSRSREWLRYQPASKSCHPELSFLERTK